MPAVRVRPRRATQQRASAAACGSTAAGVAGVAAGAASACGRGGPACGAGMLDLCDGKKTNNTKPITTSGAPPRMAQRTHGRCGLAWKPRYPSAETSARPQGWQEPPRRFRLDASRRTVHQLGSALHGSRRPSSSQVLPVHDSEPAQPPFLAGPPARDGSKDYPTRQSHLPLILACRHLLPYLLQPASLLPPVYP